MTIQNDIDIFRTINNLYNMDGTTWREVLAEMYNRFGDMEKAYKEFETKFDIKFPDEVKFKLNALIEDGTLGNLINNNLLGDINTKVDKTKEELTSQLEEIAQKEKLERLNVVTHFGVKNDGTDTTDTLNIAVNSGYPLYFPKGTYLHKDKITLTNENTPNWKGEGSEYTIIKFDNQDIEAGIYRRDCQTSGWKMKGITIDGTSKALLSSTIFPTTNTNKRHGIYSDVRNGFPGSSRPSYDLHFEDVQCTNWSGDGTIILDWFQQKYEGCYARHIGGNGFQLGGDQFTTFINSMKFNLDIDGASWWFLGGTPFLQGLNCGNVGIGLRLGADSSHVKGISYCKPTIIGLNIEPINDGGTGIYIENGSGINSIGSIIMYTSKDKNVQYGLYAKYLNEISFLSQGIVFNNIGTGTFTNKNFVTGFNSNGGFLILGNSFIETFNNKNAVINLKNDGGYLTTDKGIKNNDIQLTGKVSVATKTITGNINIRRDTGTQDDYIILADATSGAITVSIDYASYLPKRQFTIKKIDGSSNGVMVSALGGNLEGNPNFFISTQYSAITIVSDGSKWHIINKI